MKKNLKSTEEIKQFQTEKKWYGIVLILLGLLGLVLPVMPGWLLIAAGVALISPKYGERLFEKIKTMFRSLIKFK